MVPRHIDARTLEASRQKCISALTKVDVNGLDYLESVKAHEVSRLGVVVEHGIEAYSAMRVWRRY